MAITGAFCTDAKLWGVHLSTDVYKIALYDSGATLNKSTAAYTASHEVAASGTYVAGGATLAGFSTFLDGDTGVADWSDPSWTAATITARGALIYNSTRANRAVAVLDFGSDITSTNGTFLVTLPAATAAAASVRIT